MKAISSICVGTLLAASLTGCSSLGTMLPGTLKTTPTITPAAPEETPSISIPVCQKTDPWFFEAPIGENDSVSILGARKVGPISLATTSLQEALMVVAPNVPSAIMPGIAGSHSANQNVQLVLSNYSGTLEDVLKVLGSQARAFISISGNKILVEPDRQFSISLPPFYDNPDNLRLAVEQAGARDVAFDRITQTISYRADVLVKERVGVLLRKMRNRPVITYDVSILEVDLTSGSQRGIDWTKLLIPLGSAGNKGAIALSSQTNAFSGAGMSSGNVTYKTGSFELNAVVQLLESVGSTKLLAQPKISMLAGDKAANLKSGTRTAYVKQITSTIATNGLAQATAQVDEILSGIDMSIEGSFHGGTIYTRLKLDLSDLIAMTQQRIGESMISLPTIGTRNYAGTLQGRPGDTILVGGIISERSVEELRGILQGGDRSIGLPTGFTASSTRSEIVVVMKPTLIEFKGDSECAR